jgi:hypothetical protein
VALAVRQALVQVHEQAVRCMRERELNFECFVRIISLHLQFHFFILLILYFIQFFSLFTYYI